MYGLNLVARLALAAFLGGIVGYEREHTNRPAGFRTHILVCVGSALSMITSEFLFDRYSGLTNLDPARLGAQVISGIGFLGAGTIIRQGLNVRGLTTAASLWAVACVGLAAGSGFYLGAVAATVLIFLTLIMLKKLEARLDRQPSYRSLTIRTDRADRRIGAISDVFTSRNINIKNIEFNTRGEGTALVKFVVRISASELADVVGALASVPGVLKVYEDT